VIQSQRFFSKVVKVKKKHNKKLQKKHGRKKNTQTKNQDSISQQYRDFWGQ
jgi:hypothetical protein